MKSLIFFSTRYLLILIQDEPRYENISSLRYMEQVLFEVLRLYPPISRYLMHISFS